MSKIVFLHATDAALLPAIAKDGLKKHTYLTVCQDIVDYYAETVCDEEKESVILAVDMDDLKKKHLHPDHPGFEEPITTCLGESEKAISKKWDKSKQRWQDSLEIVKSVCYHAVIAPEVIRVVDEAGEHHLLLDYLAVHAY